MLIKLIGLPVEKMESEEAAFLETVVPNGSPVPKIGGIKMIQYKSTLPSLMEDQHKADVD